MSKAREAAMSVLQAEADEATLDAVARLEAHGYQWVYDPVTTDVVGLVKGPGVARVVVYVSEQDFEDNLHY